MIPDHEFIDLNLVLRGWDHFDLSICVAEMVGMCLHLALYLMDVFLRELKACAQFCTSFAVFLTLLSNRLLVASKNDCRQA